MSRKAIKRHQRIAELGVELQTLEPLIPTETALQALRMEQAARQRLETELDRVRAELEIEKTRLYEQVRHQHEQLNKLTNQLRQLTHQVIRAQEEERRRVSRELHDQAGQSLTVLKVSLELMLASQMENPSDPLLYRRLREAIDLCDSTMANIRLLAHNLRPAALDDLGLNLTLEGFCRDFAERTGLQISYMGIETPPLADAAEISLYRFLQEGLTNVAKHACATHVRVRLYSDDHTVRLAVEDNGQGFERPVSTSSRNHTNGIGLLGLQERLVAQGGRLEITSQPGIETCLMAIVPWKEAS